MQDVKRKSPTPEFTNSVSIDTLPHTSQKQSLYRLLREEKFKDAYYIAKALDSIGIVEGTFALSQMFHHGYYVTQNYFAEVKLLQKASKKGFKLAQFRLALALMLGKGVEEDLEMGHEMMFDLSDDGYEPAQEFLLVEDAYDCECCHGGCGEGSLVKCGESLDVVMGRLASFIEMGDLETAFELATELHEMEVANGTYTLSIFYHNGDYVAQDFKKEVELLQKAAEQGFEPALFNLALALIAGKGIKEDVVKAMKMMHELAYSGYEPAIELIEEVVGDEFALEIMEEVLLSC